MTAMSESRIRVSGVDSDPVAVRFEQAIDDGDWSGCAAIATYYRAKAARAEGELAGLRETLDYLKWRLKLAEGREDVTVVEPRGNGDRSCSTP